MVLYFECKNDHIYTYFLMILYIHQPFEQFLDNTHLSSHLFQLEIALSYTKHQENTYHVTLFLS